MAIIIMSPAQCRMARAGLGLGVLELAKLANISTNTIVRFERGEKLKESTIHQIKTIFEAAGIELIPEDEHGGAGIRLSKLF
jgi:transcriptional regulator with XRE-family HTH domain